MRLYLRLAWRNIWRHSRRTIIVVIAIALTMSMMMLYDGFVAGFDQAIYGNAVKVLGGNIQVHASGYNDSADQLPLLPVQQPEAVVKAAQALPQTVAAVQRINTGGLASNREGAFSVSIVGIEPENERAFSLISQNVSAGKDLSAVDLDVALIGRGLAEAMSLQVGDRFTLVGKDVHDQMRQRTMTVGGIYDIGMRDIEKRTVYMSLGEAQGLYGLNGQVTEVVIALHSMGGEDQIMETLRPALGSNEISSWETSFPELSQALGTKSAVMSVFSIIILCIVGIGIMNLLMMAVFERTREIGLMGALGMKPRQISALFLLEGGMMGLVGVVAGAILGSAFLLALGQVGFDYSQFSSMTEYTALISGRIYPTLEFGHLLQHTVTVIIIALLASFYPARAANRPSPCITYEVTMIQIIKMAYRDLGRNRRRSFFSALALSIGLALLMLMAAFIEGEMRGALDAAIRLQSGHLQVQASNYNENKASLAWEDLLEDPASMAAKVASLPQVKTVSPRLFASGIVSVGENTAGVLVTGIDPTSPANAPFQEGMVSGSYLTADDRDGLLIGQSLARKLNLSAGQKVNLLVNTSNGDLDEQTFTIRGIFNTSTPSYDQGTVFLPLAKAQAITQTENHASSLFVLLNDRDQTEAVAQALQGSQIKVVTWQQANALVLQTEEFSSAYMAVLYFIVLAVTATVIVNTLVMSVFERTREIGILSAMGMKSGSIMGMFFVESGILAVGGILMGLVLGGLLVAYTSTVGIYLGDFGVTGMLLGERIYSYLTLEDGLTLTLITFVITLVAALYPAILAARMEPVQALHGGN